MKHILVLWKDEEKWDVYPITAVVDASVGLELLRDPCGALKRLQSDFIEIRWDATKPAAPAKILAVGSLASMEKKRNNRVAARGNKEDRVEDEESECRDDQADKVEQLQATVERLDSELRKTKEQLQQTQDCLDSAKMVKRLKHILDKAEGGEDSRVSVVSAPKVDLGEGVLLDDATLTRL
ncbi:hypothetical protein HPB49_013366 [Dermacentor silvarum]|uniref:Uncharacterized protein n=1 Tax=Dermacentor silvarum TaxID=543639 RepID=A0ACB8C3U1_DERSI|nr:hypothetical protein HPB49_013366 [Dermacentor silvarum]